MIDYNTDVLHKILDQDATDAKAGKLEAGSPAWKVGTFYAACMDTTTIDTQGITPLKPELDLIAGIKTTDDLTRAIGALEHKAGLAPWTDGSTQDSKDATSVIGGLSQGGLTLPDRDYYIKTDTASKGIRDKYVAHMVAMFQLMGDAPDQAATEAKTVLAFETKLANASRTRVALRDPNANYHKMTVAEVNKLTPHFSWTTFFKAQNAPDIPNGRRGTARVLPGCRWDAHQCARGRLEGLPALARRERRGRIAQHALCVGGFQIQSGVQWRQGAPAPLEALLPEPPMARWENSSARSTSSAPSPLRPRRAR